MESYTLQRMLNVIHANAAGLSAEQLEQAIHGVSTDTRTIAEGDVFFALKGERFDGGAFVEEAGRRGAALSVVSEGTEVPESITTPHAVVENTFEALKTAAADYRSAFTGTVVGVTGTSGKTTVKEMLLAVLGTQHQVHGTKGNYNNLIGLPLSLFGLRHEHDCAVFELGMSAAGEIAALANICRPDIGVILNVGAGHAAFFKSVEAIADAKMELLDALPEHGIAIVNGDDPLLASAHERTRARLVRFGMNGNCEYHAGDIVFNGDGCAQCRVNGDSLKLQVPGFHMIYNALAAYAVGREMGVPGDAIAEVLASFKAPALRMERFMKNGVLFINDAYNANPLSMSAAAEVVRIMRAERKIAVLGDMLELGAMSAAAHHDIGKRFAGTGIDKLCLVGESSALYAEGAREGGLAQDKIVMCGTTSDAAAFVEKETQPGDLVFVKGSRALKMERIITLATGSG